jgi:feruloyl esterase
MTKPVPGQANPWAPSPPPAGFIIAHSFLKDMFIDDANYDFIKQLDWNNPADRARLAAGYDRADISGRHPEELAALKSRGGKIIYWQGIADPGIPVSLIITHYETLEQTVPGAHDFARLFLAPGTYHCGGGNGPQDVPDRALEKIIAWVERGVPPQSIVASAPGFAEGLPSGMPGAPDPNAPISPTRTVLLCPFPQVAKFKGGKSDFAYDESNWECLAH